MALQSTPTCGQMARQGHNAFIFFLATIYNGYRQAGTRGLVVPKSHFSFKRVMKKQKKKQRNCPAIVFTASISIRHADSETFRHNILCAFNSARLKS